MDAPYWIGVGDIHDDVGNLAAIPGLKEATGVIISGDLTIRGRAAGAGRVVDAVAAYNPNILAQIGNMDYAEAQDMLDERGMGIHASGRELAPGVAVIGVGWSTPTPFGTPSETSEERLGEWLEKAYAEIDTRSRLILVSHTPPYKTATDRLAGGAHVGSSAVRAFIERVQPNVCLTGHIHEARAEDVVGRTKVVNPGMLSGGGYVRIEADDQGVRAELRLI